MFSGQHFYHRGIRKNVVVFGNLFNDIQLVRYEKGTYVETERFKVPIVYAGKENFVSRIFRDPDIIKETQVKLPRMSFEIYDIQYDVSRKLSNYNSQFSNLSSTGVKRLAQGTPYDIGFELNIYVRNVEDGTQIVEQILPYFNPDYTVTMNLIDGLDVKRDVPVILNSVTYAPSYEGDGDTARMLIWTLRFTMKTWFFGNVADSKIIRKATANIYHQIDGTLEYQSFRVTDVSGTFKFGERVYQGSKFNESDRKAEIYDYIVEQQGGDGAPQIGILTIKNLTSAFNLNEKITGAESGITALPTENLQLPQQLVNIVVTPNPVDAEPDDDYGFTVEITEFPNIPYTVQGDVGDGGEYIPNPDA